MSLTPDCWEYVNWCIQSGLAGSLPLLGRGNRRQPPAAVRQIGPRFDTKTKRQNQVFLDGLRQTIGSVFHKIADFAHIGREPAPRLPKDTLTVSPEARAAQAQQDDGDNIMAAVFPGQESGGWGPIQLTENRATPPGGRGRRQSSDDSVLA